MVFRYWKSESWELKEEEETLRVNPLDGDVYVNFVNINSGYDVSKVASLLFLRCNVKLTKINLAILLLML